MRNSLPLVAFALVLTALALSLAIARGCGAKVAVSHATDASLTIFGVRVNPGVSVIGGQLRHVE